MNILKFEFKILVCLLISSTFIQHACSSLFLIFFVFFILQHNGTRNGDSAERGRHGAVMHVADGTNEFLVNELSVFIYPLIHSSLFSSFF